MRFLIAVAALAFLASMAGGFFVFNKEKKIVIENRKVEPQNISTPIPAIQQEELLEKSEELVAKAENLIFETQQFILITQALEKSSNVKGVYTGAVRNFSNFETLLDETELNGLVIDIKETYGRNLSASLKNSISELHKKDIWTIARIVVFRDSSLVQEKPEWYLSFASTTDTLSTSSGQAATTTVVWQDNAKQYWLDPKNKDVQNYIIEFSKKAIDYGFDELQFDYIRYPDDYNYVPGPEKVKTIGDFFSSISLALREYKPSIILSVDLFGYVAAQFNSYDIGQRLIDAGRYFDYISFMLYPSHFYGGFIAPEDSKRQLPAVYFPYKDANTTTTSHLAPDNPYDVVFRSVLSSVDYLDFYRLKAKIRPWLQDFDLKADISRGIFYDAEKVRLEISAAEDSGSSGWLLWNSSYAYTEEALK